MDPTVEASLIGAAAALIGVGGTVIVAITAARNTRQTNQAAIDAAHADAQLTLDATREAQFADRYSRALEQVGSGNLDVRIGGIYALEGIALDSPRHHPTVMEVLTAFIREHSHMPPEGRRPIRRPLPDVQAALTVAGRRKAEHDIRRMNLSDAQLLGADLARADLTEADLTGAYLGGADLTEADLTAANLTSVGLYKANLTGADLTGANLTEAVLAEADLTRANLTRADLKDAYWPHGVNVPEGWTAADGPEEADVVRLRRADTGPSAAAEGGPLQRDRRSVGADLARILRWPVGAPRFLLTA